jgi:cobalt-precorrin-6B (C15)-methyltransferase
LKTTSLKDGMEKNMIKDSDFITSENIPGPTKEEIRCLVICKSEISDKNIVVEVGCGTGGLTLEFAKRSKKVYAIDKNPDALKLTKHNLEKHGLSKNVEILEGDALDILDKLPNFDILMIGGSNGELPSIIEKGYDKLKKKGKILITAILLETKYEAVKTLQSLGMELEVTDVSISNSRIIERGTMMISRNPITIITSIK